ncbi:MAG: aminoglycoside phosphotransferase family protein [Gemmatales bacterium]|nr:aminoglycoside phosphotransferase family protein [Gemmatales bacterium]MDW8176268.1 aminoglycoside phosphotransferase family protein [Gemmatales bacterium]
MWEITPENAVDYLRASRLWADEVLGVEPLGWGVSNLVLRIRTAQRWYVLKQSRPQLRTKELWRSDPDRIFREAQALQALAPLLPVGVVPQVFHVDHNNYCLLMEHAPPQAAVWKGELLAGRITLPVAGFAGYVLGRIHEATRCHSDWQQAFSDRRYFWQLRTEPFYLRLLPRHPEVAEVLRSLVHRLDRHAEALCHGDFTPKNFLVWPDRNDGFFTLVDYEVVCFGDPAFDLGLFLAHLLLKAIRLAYPLTEYWHMPTHTPHGSSSLSRAASSVPPWTEQMLVLTRQFWSSYRQHAPSVCTSEHEHWSRLHCGACMLTRIDGTSPVDYLPDEPLRQLVRHFAKSLLLAPPSSWDEVITRLQTLLREQVRPETQSALSRGHYFSQQEENS